MSTKRALVQQAYDEIGLGTYTWDSSAGMRQSAVDRMNRLATRWESVGILTGYNLGGLIDDESGVPDTVEDAYILQLALRLAPTMGKIVSMETKVAAKQAYDALMIATMRVIPYKVTESMPLGRGNVRRQNRNNFVSNPDELNVGLGALEL